MYIYTYIYIIYIIHIYVFACQSWKNLYKKIVDLLQFLIPVV